MGECVRVCVCTDMSVYACTVCMGCVYACACVLVRNYVPCVHTHMHTVTYEFTRHR